MSITTKIERYIPNIAEPLTGERVGQSAITINGQELPHQETLDFPLSDPWSLNMRRIIAKVRESGGFIGQEVTELGVGDGRNLRELGNKAGKALGVDIEDWRLRVAGVNLVTGPAPLDTTVDLWRGDAVEFLQQLEATGRKRLSGWVIMCLPQSPSGVNFADRYDGLSTLDSYRADWEQSGLTLNAATLSNLRERADRLKVLVILSDRVPPQIRAKLLLETGWQVDREFQTPEPIQQDPDTGIDWVSQIDDGKRFYEWVATDYRPISAIEAEKRRLASLDSGTGRERLNVYHHLSVYQLSPH